MGKVEEAKVMWSALSNLGAELDCVDGKGRTALWMEAEKGEVEVVRELHRMGASVETLSELGFDGTTPHRSHYSPQLKIHRAPTLTSSLSPPPLPNTGDDGILPIFVAAKEGEMETVRVLYELGASVEGIPSGPLLCRLSGFTTAAAPGAVARRGQVRYEITLKVVGGYPQIGWATPKFETTSQATNKGTGDDEHSWGADGARQVSFHDGRGQYDVTWSTGDVIGVAADLDARTLSFAKNGDWIEVFKECDFGDEGIFPSITLKDGECEVNLGASPFKFPGPSDGYQPVGPEVRVLDRHRGERSAFKGSFKV